MYCRPLLAPEEVDALLERVEPMLLLVAELTEDIPKNHKQRRIYMKFK
jgi:hypothetical protein